MAQAEEFANHDEIFLWQEADAMAKVLRACNTQDVHEPVQFALVAIRQGLCLEQGHTRCVGGKAVGARGLAPDAES